MSRYIGKWDAGKILSAADHWRQNCLEKNDSIFLNTSDIWALPRFEDLEKYFIDAPDA